MTLFEFFALFSLSRFSVDHLVSAGRLAVRALGQADLFPGSTDGQGWCLGTWGSAWYLMPGAPGFTGAN